MIQDLQDVKAFVTKKTWSLDKFYCSSKQMVVVIEGAEAITTDQIHSSVACAIGGNLLVFYLVIAFMVYYDAGLAAVLIGIVMLIACWIWPHFGHLIFLYKQIQHMLRESNGTTNSTRDAETGPGGTSDTSQEGQDSNLGLYFVFERKRTACPKPVFGWIMVCVELILFFLCPVISLFALESPAIAFKFLLVAAFVAARYYLSPVVVIEGRSF